MSPTKPKRDDLLTAAAIAPDMQSIAPRTVVRPIKTFFFRQRILSLRFPVMMAAAKKKASCSIFFFPPEQVPSKRYSEVRHQMEPVADHRGRRIVLEEIPFLVLLRGLDESAMDYRALRGELPTR